MSATESTTGGIGSFFRTLVQKKKPEPSYPRLPRVDSAGHSNVEGLWLAGEVAGTPLIKLGLNQGVEVIDHIQEDLKKDGAGGGDGVLDVLIVGAGSSGLGAASRAHELGLHYVVLEAERVATTVVDMYKGKHLFAEPHDVENKSSMWFEECSREDLLEKWSAQIQEMGLRVHEHEKVEDIRKKGDVFEVTSEDETYRSRRVLLAIGKAGNPRKAGVPGEHKYATRVQHGISDPEDHQGEHVFIYGGGDVACEAALALCERAKVTMVTIDECFIYPKKRNADRVSTKAQRGKIDLHFSSQLKEIKEDSVVFTDKDGEEHEVHNDLVLEMIGAELPLKFFDRVGIKLEGTWDVKRWATLAVISLFVYSLYALKKYPESPYSWPFNHLIGQESFASVTASLFDVAFLPFRWVFSAQAYADMRATLWFQQGYLYSLLYTIVMVVFGYQAFVRWGSMAKDPRYQKWRYVSLISFQVGFFLIANVVAVQALSIEHAWRAWGLYQPWPLFFNTFHWFSDSDPDVVLFTFIGVGLFGTFVAIPFASWKHGKRFCTWVCGCGGLAETLGDRWRHLSPKGERSRAWEFQGVVIFIAVTLVTLVTVGIFDTRANNAWASAYSYFVDFWLVAVIPIALYPFFGGKVWCRYWCPLAAYNGILAKVYGRLRIVADDTCITCTQCSKYCQVGVDVMAFAKNQESFDNDNSACIQCGICIDVCPMNTLSFDNAPRKVFREEMNKSGVSSYVAAKAAQARTGRSLPVVNA